MAIIWFNDGSQGILQRELFPISHYEYGEPYFGSYRGMRFRIAREPLENVHFTPADKRGPAVLRVVIWPEPYSYEKTEEEKKVTKDFAFTKEGLDEVGPYLNAYYEEHREEWPGSAGTAEEK
ncbi:MAG: hypothetical protein PUE63_09325 [Lachnospiraceae bacterium]|nr:hypothetical protein [Lachnospiraceae bacterium]